MLRAMEAAGAASAVMRRPLSSEMRTGTVERRNIGTSRPPPPHFEHGSLREPRHLVQPLVAFLAPEEEEKKNVQQKRVKTRKRGAESVNMFI